MSDERCLLCSSPTTAAPRVRVPFLPSPDSYAVPCPAWRRTFGVETAKGIEGKDWSLPEGGVARGVVGFGRASMLLWALE